MRMVVLLVSWLLSPWCMQIYSEKEHAQLTRMLAEIREVEGDIEVSSQVMQEVNVETYGALTVYEKVDFILEQIRLLLLKQDYVRAFIVSKKISRKNLAQSPELQPLKLRFYRLMVRAVSVCVQVVKC